MCKAAGYEEVCAIARAARCEKGKYMMMINMKKMIMMTMMMIMTKMVIMTMMITRTPTMMIFPEWGLQSSLQCLPLIRRNTQESFSDQGFKNGQLIRIRQSYLPSFSARSTFCDSKFSKLTNYPPAQVFTLNMNLPYHVPSSVNLYS